MFAFNPLRAFGLWRLHRSDDAYCTYYGAFREAKRRRFAYAERMSVYRLQYVDVFSGNVMRARDFEAATEEAAITYAEEARGLASMELWDADRKIKHWDAFPSTA